MEPEHIRFGGGAADTLLHPLVALWMVIAVLLILCLPRKYVIAPLLLAIFSIPIGQVVVLGGVHFTVARILILAGLVRWAVSGRLSPGGSNPIDQAFTLWALVYFIVFSMQWMDRQALVNRLGNLLDSLGGYYVLRFLIQDRKDVRRVVKVFAVVCAILGACMINEQVTHRNIFGLLGGVGLASAVREGQTRSQGAFEIYITAGVFGATLLPLFIWLWSDAKSRVPACLGIAGASAMTLTSSSSTALLAYVAGIVGFCFWPLRKRMRAFRWGLVLTLVGLHLVMKAPVWALIARIDLTGSSSGYHRYMLVDNCLRHLSDWWLLGVRNYQDWGWDTWDLANQYVTYALTGGLATLVMFILIISRSFGRLGTARKLAQDDPKHEWSLWCLCAAMLAHVVAYFGIGYFDQMQFAWYALLAIISVAVSEAMRSPVLHAQEALAPSYQTVVAMDWQL